MEAFNSLLIQVDNFLWGSVLVIGATIQIDLIWNLCDIMNGCMALPNLVALLFLSGVVARDLAEYNQKIPEFERALN
jgi:AGCS family alanine or glycine:cation symporter